MNTFGSRYRTTLFGASHGPFVGCPIEGRRAGAPLVVSGAIARQVLEAKSIQFFAHAAQIGRVTADAVTPKQIEANVERTPVRCADLEAADRMIAEIEEARKGRDSVGGVIEGMVTGLPPGIGEPFFDSVESSLAHLLFSIPAVKGVDFGAGFRGAAMPILDLMIVGGFL